MVVYFRHVEGSKKGQVERFDLARIRVGRAADSDLRFDSYRDREVSGLHAEIYRAGEAFIIEDLNSTNGTYVNGRRIEEPTRISDGDVIEFATDGPKAVFSTKEPGVPFGVEEEGAGSPRTIVIERGQLGAAGGRTKTLGMMINDALLHARSSSTGRVGTSTLFLRELARQASAHSSRRMRVTLVSLIILLILIPGSLVYVNYQKRQQLEFLKERQKRQLEVITKQQAEIEKFRGLTEGLKQEGIEAQETKRGVSVNLPSVLFAPGRSDLTSEGKGNVKKIASVLKEHAAEKKILAEGHSSQEKGVDEKLNQRLSEERANRIAASLAASGVPKQQITAKGFGSSRPVASNDSEEGRRRNRRVEVVIEK